MAKTRQSTRASHLAVVDNADTKHLKRGSGGGPPRKKVKIQHDSGDVPSGLQSVDDVQEESQSNTKRKRKAKNAEIDSTHFLPRTDSHWKVGAHVSAAGGVENAVTNAATIGATAFALFLKSQRKWESPTLKDTSIAEFKKRMTEFGYTPKVILPHGSYLINLGNPDAGKREKSYACFLDDLQRCETLGLQLYSFHPGSTVGEATLATSIAHIANCINRAHKETENVTIVLENMAGGGNIIGSEFSHLASIIELVEEKSRVGVCLDTCHAFAAGYDIRTLEGWNSTITKFDELIGLKYLCGMHLNDSKTACNSKRDRHENIGLGHLGLLTFQHILTDPRTQGIPLILETPSFEQPAEVWGLEIGVLQRVSSAVSKAGSPGGAKQPVSSSVDLVALVNEVKQAVECADKNNKKGKEKATRKEKVKKVGKVGESGTPGNSGKAGKAASKRKWQDAEYDGDGNDGDDNGDDKLTTYE